MISNQMEPKNNNTEIIEGLEVTVYKSINFRINSGEGTFYFSFDEDRTTGKLVRILGWGGKTGSSQFAWLDSLLKIVSRQLERNLITIEELKTELSSSRSDKIRIMKDGIECSSGPEALFIALLRYTDLKYQELIKDLPIPLRSGRG